MSFYRQAGRKKKEKDRDRGRGGRKDEGG